MEVFTASQLSLFPNVPARWDTVPHDGGPGPFDFYATFDVDSQCSYIPQDVAVLLPASSFARDSFPRPYLPAHIKHRAADSGGFVASRIWGEYRYSLAQYVEWLTAWSPLWAATMDYCCEPELEVVTRERQEKTTRNAWQAWEMYRFLPFAWVPTLQGWLPADYRRHALELKPLIEEMQAFYAGNSSWRVGVGTLCRRNDVVMIEAILREVRAVLPGVPLHLWGIKLDALRSINLLQVVSTDSAAWHGKFYGDVEVLRERAREAGVSMRKYSVTVNLPAYIQKVHAAVVQSRQVVGARQDRDLLDQVREVLRNAGGWTLDLSVHRNRVYAYAVRRTGTKREKRYLGPVSDGAQWLERLPGRDLGEQDQLRMEKQCSLTCQLGGTLFPTTAARVNLYQ